MVCKDNKKIVEIHCFIYTVFIQCNGHERNSSFTYSNEGPATESCMCFMALAVARVCRSHRTQSDPSCWTRAVDGNETISFLLVTTMSMVSSLL
jgi:hypothetical protein